MSTSATLTELDPLLKLPEAPAYARIGRVVMGLLLLFVLWSVTASLEEVAVAEGEVVPQEQIQAVQHLEGGIVEKIFVHEGSRVQEGEELVQLNITSFISTREELEFKSQSLHLKRVRLQAEAQGAEKFEIPQEYQGYRASFIQSEQLAFDGRRQKLHSSLSLYTEQMRQRELDVQQLKTERDSISGNLAVLREKLKISSNLVKDKLTSKLDHLQLQSEVKELEGRLDIIKVAIPRGEAALEEARERYRNEALTFANTALEELNQVEQEIASTEELLKRATDQVQRTTITSPITGIIKTLNVHTLGGVVRPGETIVEIVPESDNLVVEVRLDPKDIGFVKTGQPALVKLLTYDYARYGGLEGEVISVSADSHLDEATQASYFLVTIRTDKNFLDGNDHALPITAGMQATAEIRTGEKKVSEYLLKPILRVKSEAFRER